jgi:hypothetical protein
MGEEPRQANNSRKTLKPADDLSSVIAKWMNVFAVANPDQGGRPQIITEERAEVYYQLLKDLTADELEVACELAAKNVRGRFPSPADIRGFLKEIRSQSESVEAEAAWIETERWVLKHYDPDNGFRMWESTNGCISTHPLGDEESWKRVEVLSDRIQTAIEAIGGYERIWYDLQSEKYPWLKKEFIESYKRAEAVEEHLQLAEGKEPKRLGQPESIGQIMKRLTQ